MADIYATQADLEIAVGGAKRLLQLADFGRTEDINNAAVQSVIQGWLADGARMVRQRALVKHDAETLANLDADSAVQVRDWNASMSARTAYERGSGGLAMPEQLGARAARADRELAELARGEIRLARVSGGTATAINQIVGVIDFDASSQGVSIAGFRRGFR